MRSSNLTVGKKLTGVFAVMSALVLALVFIYVTSYRQSNRLMESILHVSNKKLDIGSQVELATTEMQGAQRGLMLSYAMKDPAAAVQYTKLYKDSLKKIDGLLVELRPLLVTAAERKALEQIMENRNAWSPRFQELTRLCESGEIAAAYKLRNQNKLLSAKMHASATALAHEQQAAMDLLQTRQAESRTASNWIAVLAVVLSMALTGLGLAVVQTITRQLRRLILELQAGADQVARAAQQISSSSQELAQGASEHAGSLEETSAASHQMASVSGRNSANSNQAAVCMNMLSERVV